MYNERRENFTIKDVILQLLFVALFIFLLIWLFPTKSFVNKKVDPLLDTIFNNNVMAMKDAAKDYFTLSRLPQEVGDKVKITLGEMLDKKLLLEFTDKYGETCDVNASYVEVTKYDEEYVMKVNLKCSKQEDHILVHMGCYDYCSTTICEKQEEVVEPKPEEKPTPKPQPKPEPKPETEKHYCVYYNGKYYDKNGNVVGKDAYDASCNPVTPKEYMCEYKKTTDAYYTEWSNWSDWTTNVLNTQNKDLEQVETEVRTTTEMKEELTGYRVTTYYDGSKPIYVTRQVAVQKKTTTVCELYGWKASSTTVTKTVKEKGWKEMGYFVSNTPVSGDAANKYELITVNSQPCDANCTIKTTYLYKWSAVEYETTYSSATSGGEYGCLKESTKVSTIYGDIDWLVGYGTSQRKDPIYTTTPVEIKTTYYRNRTRSLVPATSDVKWDSCENSELVNQGYVFTGNKKEK